MTRGLLVGQTLLLAVVAVFLGADWQARRADGQRWQALEARLGEWERVQAALPVLPALAAGLDRDGLARQIATLVDRAPIAAGSACALDDAQERNARSPEADKKPLTDDAEARAREAEQIVTASLMRGSLRVADVMQLRHLELGSQGHPAFASMRDRIIAAINDQRLQPEDLAFISF